MPDTSPISPGDLQKHYNFPAGATGRGHRVVLLQFGGGFHDEDLSQHLSTKLGVAAASVPPVETAELGVPNFPLQKDRLAEIARDLEKPGATFAQLEARHGSG